ncbi:TonB-dependent receptor [Erythrobacter sp.]|jgi:iron complex outermembrane receptor protein|uniref:TonB-dependent receptor n=1 Tax=Erythrobacter sp. TaxID=1042 RepID=UPI002EAF1C03|nr:TonB-dependent receptor [Erythrobacter sp.]
MRGYSRLQLAAGTALAGFLVGTPGEAHAQVSGNVDAEKTDEAEQTANDIVVTARRREETLQDVPLAVTAFSSEALFDAQIENLVDLSGKVPNLNISFITSTTTAIIYLRGAGQDDTNPPSEQPITIYLDDVPYLKAPGAVFDLIALESVEVLRGPQGTLYGRNATGGAIKLLTRRPDLDEATGIARITVGSFGQVDFAGSFSAPLSDTFAVRVDGVSRSSDGFIRDAFADEDPTRPDRYNAIDTNTARIAALWQPTDRLEIYAAADYTENNPGPFTATPAATTTLEDNFVDGEFVDSPDLFGDPFLAAPTLFGESAFTGYGGTLQARYDFDTFDVRAIFGYRGFQQDDSFDTDGGPSIGTFEGEPFTRTGNGFDFVRDWEHDAYTLELRAASAGSGKLNWVGGLFLLREENVATSVLGRFTDPANLDNPSATAQDQDQTTDSIAVFGEVSYRPIDRLELTAGLRYTHDEKELTVEQYGAFDLPLFFGTFFPPFGPLEADESFDRFTPRFIADFEVTDDISVYASYSQGFQAGAFQGFQLTAANAVVPIEETVVHSYEVGLRSSWLNDRLVFNVTAFQADYNELPTTQFESASGFLEARTFDATIRGLEFDIFAEPLDGFTLTAAFALTQDETPIDDPETIAPSMIPGVIENELKYVSPFNGFFSAQYEHRLPGTAGSVNAIANLTVQDEFFTTTVNNPFSFEDGYALLGAQIEYETFDEAWTAAVGVRNLTDEIYESRASIGGGGGRFYGAPRTWYATVQYEF